MKRLIATALLAFAPMLAADLNGTWTGTAETSAGSISRTFKFHADGSKLTGETVSEYTGTSEIKNGKVNGQQVSFDINVEAQGEKMTIHYEGQLDGDQLKLSADVPAL